MPGGPNALVRADLLSMLLTMYREICKLVACGMSVPHHTWSGDRGYAMCNDNTQRGYETCNNNNIFV